MLANDLRRALDPAAFGRGYFDLDPWQEGFLTSAAPRILLNCCRQAGKSTIAAMLALHAAYFNGDLVLLLSPSLRQSQELFRKVLDFVRGLDGPKPEAESALRIEFTSRGRIISLPGKEQTVRGYSGVDLLIVDEAARVPDDLYFSVRPMLAVSGGRLILMSTPFGKRGHFFDEYTRRQGWELVEVKATECPRIPEKFLEDERASLGDWWFRQEYMCEFVETVDQIFSYDVVMAALSGDISPIFGEGVI